MCEFSLETFVLVKGKEINLKIAVMVFSQQRQL